MAEPTGLSRDRDDQKAVSDEGFRGDLVDHCEGDPLDLLGRPLGVLRGSSPGADSAFALHRRFLCAGAHGSPDDDELTWSKSKPGFAIFRLVIEVAYDDGNQLALANTHISIDFDELDGESKWFIPQPLNLFPNCQATKTYLSIIRRIRDFLLIW